MVKGITVPTVDFAKTVWTRSVTVAAAAQTVPSSAWLAVKNAKTVLTMSFALNVNDVSTVPAESIVLSAVNAVSALKFCAPAVMVVTNVPILSVRAAVKNVPTVLPMSFVPNAVSAVNVSAVTMISVTTAASVNYVWNISVWVAVRDAPTVLM